MEYKIEWAGDGDLLVQGVMNSMKRGWKPIGGVAIVGSDQFAGRFYQAMVRTSKGNDEGESVVTPD